MTTVPVVAAAGHPSRVAAGDIRCARFRDVIAKPVEPAELLAVDRVQGGQAGSTGQRTPMARPAGRAEGPSRTASFSGAGASPRPRWP